MAVERGPGKQTTAPNRSDDEVEVGRRPRTTRSAAVPCPATTRGFVERMDQGGAASLSLPIAGRFPLGLFAEDDLRAVAAHRRHLDRRSVVGHHHGAGNPADPGGIGQRGGMVAGGMGDHPAGGLPRRRGCSTVLTAPRALKAPTFWRFSHLKKTCAPSSRSNVAEVMTGVRCTKGAIRCGGGKDIVEAWVSWATRVYLSPVLALILPKYRASEAPKT